MHQQHRKRWIAGALTCAAAVAVPAQTPDRATPAPAPLERPAKAEPVDAALGKAQQALIDEFLQAMPRDPTELRKAETRAQIAAKCLPVLRRVRTFAATRPQTMLAERVAEFRIYSLVLGDAELRAELTKARTIGNLDATVQLAVADAIVATESKLRQRAIADLAAALAKVPETEELPPEAPSRVVDCAVYCLLIAAIPDDAELELLNAKTNDKRLSKRFTDLAEQRRRDLSRVVGKPFAIDGNRLDGTKFTTESQRGKVVIVDFWATWCGPCVRAMPELVRVSQSIDGERLAVVGISCDESLDSVQEFLAAHPEVDWPQLFEPGQRRWHPIATKLGVTAIPRILVIDASGKLFHANAGKDLEAIVRDCLAR